MGIDSVYPVNTTTGHRKNIFIRYEEDKIRSTIFNKASLDLQKLAFIRGCEKDN